MHSHDERDTETTPSKRSIQANQLQSHVLTFGSKAEE